MALSLAVSSLTIPASYSKIYYTEHNWHTDPSGFLETVNSGAYIKVRFNGSSFTLNLDETYSKAASVICWSVDDGPEHNQTLPAVSKDITIASGLKKDVAHSLYLFVRSHVSNDRWYNPDTRIRIMSVTIDDGAALFAPNLAPKRLMVYGDSIGEGIAVNGNLSWQYAHDAHLTWAFSMALGLNAELSLVAFSGQGYTQSGAGRSPQVWSASGLSNESAWNWLSEHYKRTFATCPDYILNGHGTNDFFADPSVVAANSVGWMKDMRNACPKSRIFLTVPFGRYSEAAIVKAFQDYQAESSDPLTYLIQLGEQGSAGLDAESSTMAAFDGCHPYGWKSSQLGALLVGKMVPLLSKGYTGNFLEI